MANIQNIMKVKEIDFNERNLFLVSNCYRYTPEQSRAIQIFNKSIDIDNVILIRKVHFKKESDEVDFYRRRNYVLHNLGQNTETNVVFMMIENNRENKGHGHNNLFEHTFVFAETLAMHKLLKNKLSVFVHEKYRDRKHLKNVTDDFASIIGFHSNIDMAAAHAMKILEMDFNTYSEKHKACYNPRYQRIHETALL